MAKHRTSTRRTARKVALGAMAAFGLSGSLVLGHATSTTAMVQLTNTVIGIGGKDDATSSGIPTKLSGTVIPKTGNFGYFGVPYPATFELDKSRDAAVPVIHDYLTNTGKDEAHLIVAGYSLGALAAEQEKRNLQLLAESDAPSDEQLSFVMIASPFGGNGGVFGRLPGVGIPFITTGMGPAQPSRYDTTYVANMYDPYADFPAYFNPVSLLNTALSIRYGHSPAYYDPLDPASSYAYETTVHNPGTGSTDKYVLYYNPHLPLLGPLRELAAMTNTTKFAEPVISSVEPLLRVLVDMGYTDRVNAKPATTTPFSLFTPPAKVIEALGAIPNALAQGAANLASGGHSTVTPPNPLGNLTPKPAAPSPKPQLLESPAPIAPAKDVPKVELDGKSVKPIKPIPAVTKLAATTTDGLRPTVTSGGNKFTPGAGTSTATGTTDTTGTTGTPTSPATPPTKVTPTATPDTTNSPAAQEPSANTNASTDAAA
ncbi:hypothetical protein ASD37_14960 [Mycobacterium sp. Root135]|uniref:PE-PPE domain-containing protein n=1 Tax=Mycobacterium sp. Root135 TaxID=1736457 RepID=UPI0006F21413|nr:PE-PPE domain-containing protein [Mycobacterium sp. Root135]KQY07337.1 hypothetical protein ASD37_14960 [Mycobacterium sp. Root135]